MDLLLFDNVIRDIDEMHQDFSKLFLEKNPKHLNLKTTTVDDVLSNKSFDPIFLEYIEEYHTALNYIWLENSLDEKYYKWDFRARVKQKESIYNKLIFYGEKDGNGKFPLQKCLNDLYGFRLIINGFDGKNIEFKDKIKSLKDESLLWKWYDRDKEGYKGTHIYFKSGKNVYFPWELQIWNTEDSKKNEQSHKMHKAKRDYVSWPQKYKDGKLEKG